MKEIRMIGLEDEKDFNALCDRYKVAFPNAGPPIDFWRVTQSYVPYHYDPLFIGIEKSIKTGKPIKNWGRLMVLNPLPQGCVA
jgi:hypothetical protein